MHHNRCNCDQYLPYLERGSEAGGLGRDLLPHNLHARATRDTGRGQHNGIA